MIQDVASRVLVLAPTTKDAEVTRALLERAGLPCVTCANVEQLVNEVGAGAGAILATEEVLEAGAVAQLSRVLRTQPVWSELPVVVLASDRNSDRQLTAILQAVPHATILDRPALMRSVLSAVRTAVRARQKQYQIRDQIEEIHSAKAALSQLLASEQAAREEAERAGRMKDDFLATLSHELRTPLNAIVGWSQLLRRRGRTGDDLEQGLDTIERNARMQAQLIDDLLDMSRIVSGKLRLDIGPIDPTAFIEAAIKTVQTAADVKRIRIVKSIDPDAGPMSGDANRLQQVVWNLLSNAIKFTPDNGQIQVVLERVESRVKLSVIDTGVGIHPDFLPHIFERFRQADASTTRHHSGLGLGLAIVKQLVELHGGSVEAFSAGVNKGSALTVWLPIDMGQATSSRLPEISQLLSNGPDCDVSLAGVKVLVVDDEPDSRELVKRILRECQAEVRSCASAVEAMPAILEFEPDVLISDIGMPEVDGYEFMRRLIPGISKKIPAIALTAFARPEDRTRALLSGYLAHLAKPVQPNELIAMVASMSRQRAG